MYYPTPKWDNTYKCRGRFPVRQNYCHQGDDLT